MQRRLRSRRGGGVRISPIVAVTILVVSSMAFVFVALPVPASATSFGPDCIPCPGGGRCYPDCGSPTITLLVSTSAESTNVTLTFVLNLAAYVTLDWGNTTAYAFTELNHQYEPTGRSAVFIDFLEPDTVYYYRATATMTGEISASRTGSFATSADSVSYFSGTVLDSNGDPPPVGTFAIVLESCAADPMPGYGGYSISWTTYTGADGRFGVDVLPYWWNPGEDQGVPCGSAGYAVEAQSSLGWPGHWNETVITFAPQVVTFHLPSNFISPYLPEVLDFSNAAPGYSSIEYSESTSLTTTFTDDWSLSGSVEGVGAGASGSSSSSVTVESGAGVGSTNGPLDYVVQYETSGVVEYSAIYREWAATSVNFYGPALNGQFASNVPGFVPPADWMYPGSPAPGLYFMKDINGEPMENLAVPAGDYHLGWVTTSTTSSTTGGYSVSLGLSGELAGVLPVSLSAQLGWSQTSSTTNSQTITWQVDPPNGGQTTCYDVFGQGGDPSQNTADMIGIWAWAPTFVNGAATCPTP